MFPHRNTHNFTRTFLMERQSNWSYCDGFAQGIAQQRSRGTPAGWRNSSVEEFPSCRRMHGWRNDIRRMRG
jgi:hypothetical protein